MTKLQKNNLVNSLTEEFKSAQAIVVAEYKGTAHKELEELRIAAKELDVKVQVAKNTLVQLAIKNVKLEELTLTGANILKALIIANQDYSK